MRWSQLPPERLAIELAKLGITPKVLALDIRDVPELREACNLLSPEKRLVLAVEYFGDQRHRQPQERTEWYTFGRTPDWGQLPQREDDEPAKHEVKGEPGRPRVLVTKDTLFEIFRQSLERARSAEKPAQPSFAAIAATNDVKRTWVTPIVKWAVAHQRDARQAIVLSEIPQRFSTIVRD